MTNNAGSPEKRFNLEDFSKKSEEYYNQIRSKLEAESKGKFVALDFESSRYWIGETATEALGKAKAVFPDKLFYVLQIGSPATFSIQSMITRRNVRRSHDFVWSH